MKFVVIGINGKMGQEVKKEILKSPHCLVAGIDTKEDVKNKVFLKLTDIEEDFDSIIDFSTAENRKDIVDYCFKNKTIYGCFSTVISEEDNKRFTNLSKSVPVLICDNASEGIILMKQITNLIAKEKINADIVLSEYHHKDKKDSPSGTAKSLANILAKENISCKTISNRVGTEIGTHSLQMFFNNESLTITHISNNRNIFAKGAIKLMNKLSTKKRGLFINEIN